MYLKSLTLRGFKSFASATTLNFEPGVTCVVGPNGSGKSNVVDALSWVMGEQGAKSLRGGKMEDVIFAGTAGRPPLGRAEVTLTIDNTDGALPIEYTEVTISRMMFRNGGSDYAINGHPARLLDVQELLSDSGIGREMHVIVGQGQLDTILQATPEQRRGFIEEAAGVLKHRKRKEKALRKLEATEANLNRLNDLIGEIRRQLKPLGRQAEVARKAAVIQAELRDAKARLLADDLVQARLALEADLADEAALKAERERVETALEAARTEEADAEEAVRLAQPRLALAQETWYALSGLRERVASTQTIAAERVRHADDLPEHEQQRGRDPEQLEREAADVRAQEDLLRREVEAKSHALADATLRRNGAEAAHAAEEKHCNALLRAAADQREGLARLTGQVNSLRSRAEAADAEIGRLEAARTAALARADDAERTFRTHETTVAGLSAGEQDLDNDYEQAGTELAAVETELDELRAAEQRAATQRSGLQARLEGLRVGLERRDASAALLAASEHVDGLLGSVASLLAVEPGYETAVSAALGTAADAVAVANLDAAVGAFGMLKEADLGRAGLLLAGSPADPEPWPDLTGGARYAVDVITCDERLRPALGQLLRKVALVADLPAAKRLVSQLPDVTAVTADGDLLSTWFSAGGSNATPSLIEIQAAVDDAEARLADALHESERLTFALAEADDRHAAARDRVEAALARLNESDAQMAGVAEQLGQLSQTARAARGEADRLVRSIDEARAARERDLTGLAELEDRLELASQSTTEVEPDPAERDRLGDEARQARSAEMDARLALRTAEERARALSGRADALRRAAVQERDARVKAAVRREQIRREGENARAVHTAAGWLLTRIDRSRERAAGERSAADSARAAADAALGIARSRARQLAKEFENLVADVHADEMARAEQRMRIEALAERALAELGIEADVLADEYGPDQMIPVLTRPDGTAITEDDERPDPVPFVRDEQAKRLRVAERNLSVLGRVNPLALGEFDAMQERHAFLAEQLDDLRKTRKDLLELIDEVDARVQQVFETAYNDVEAAFETVFARLFPGGEGRLVLTEPGEWLTTGVDVEARPPGKKVKRLSLLSGGERSLVAVAFLVSLFMARPSPFYILDEVEAALDDTNLGRLLEIYEELRVNSQLLVITHQKRTMEIADALYGVTMRGDGVSTVISQRLREQE